MTITTRPSVHELAARREAPAVSIVCPLDRTRPGNTRDVLEIAALHKAAIADVTSQFGAPRAELIDAQIEAALRDLDLEHPPAGVALFADSEFYAAVPLTHVHAPRYRVGTRFSLREVLASESERASFLMLVLTRSQARCFVGNALHLDELRHDGFPMSVSAPVEADTPQRDFPLSEHEDDEAVLFALREAGRALHEVAQRTHLKSLVVVGTARDLAYFDELDLGDVTPIADIHGNHIEDTTDALITLIAPVVAEHTHDANEALCRTANEAVGAGAVSAPLAARDVVVRVAAASWSSSKRRQGRRPSTTRSSTRSSARWSRTAVRCAWSSRACSGRQVHSC